MNRKLRVEFHDRGKHQVEHLDIWKDIHDKNLKASRNYLSLRLPDKQADQVVDAIDAAPLTFMTVETLFMQCGLEPVSTTNLIFKREMRHLIERGWMHAVCVAQFAMRTDISDGYHRASVAHWLDPSLAVACRVGRIA